MRDGKEVFLNGEGDSYFIRNKEVMENRTGGGYAPYSIVKDFLYSQNICGKDKKILEVGCCFGHNLAYLKENLGISCYGIEPSLEAVNYGMEKYLDIVLKQGTSDELLYSDNMFDVVIMGFCLFWVDRKYLLKSASEADRVLRDKGFLVIHDFDTAYSYKRDNIHNAEAFTYKMDYAKLFLANPQYYLVEKRSLLEMGDGFNPDIQERRSLQILYKDCVNNTYIY